MQGATIEVPKLTGDKVHLWVVHIPRDSINIKMPDVLNKEEQHRMSKYRFAEDRQTFAITRSALRTLLGHYVGVSPRDIEFRFGLHGKPELPDHPVEFNVSHSGDMAVIGITTAGPIGVDIELIKPEDRFPNDEVLQVGKSFFSPAEYKRLSALNISKRRLAFFQCWTRKEAFIKAEGSGLSFPLDQFEVSFGEGKPFDLLRTNWDLAERDLWSVFSFARPGYVGAAAVKGKVSNWDIAVWPIES